MANANIPSLHNPAPTLESLAAFCAQVKTILDSHSLAGAAGASPSTDGSGNLMGVSGIPSPGPIGYGAADQAKFRLVDIIGSAPAVPVLERIYQQSLLKAWCFCTVAGGAVTIVGGFNVSSVTYVAVGKFTINFATALADTKYGWSGANRDAANASWLREVAGGTRSTSALAIQNGTAAALDDPDDFSVIVFGN